MKGTRRSAVAAAVGCARRHGVACDRPIVLRDAWHALTDCVCELARSGHPEDVHAMLAAVEPSADVDLLLALADRAYGLDGQTLHGDPHLGNCMQAASGPVWHDFESACRGPREYDLAALLLADRRIGSAPAREALTAYGSYDAALVDELLPAYAAWVYTSMLIALPRRPELRPVLADRIAWLRGYVRERGQV